MIVTVSAVLLGWLVGAAPIVNGDVDPNHPAVVALGQRATECGAPFNVSCTGTLIAPRVVLTAAHCVQPGARGGDVLVGRSASDRDAIYRAVEVFIHPQYDDATDANDIALVVLDRSAAVTPLAVRDHPLDAADVTRSVTLVGFGTPGGAELPGTKRVGTAVIQAVFANGFQIGPAPAMTCKGDSGGPALVTETTGEVVVGVAVTGDLACDSVGVHADAGSYYADFIVPVLDHAAALAEPGPRTIGVASVCSSECNADGDCPVGFSCVGEPGQLSRCQSQPQPAGDYGDICGSDADCRGVPCADLPAQNECRCFHACDDIPPPPGDDGCGCRAGDPGSSIFAVLLLLFGLFKLSVWRSTSCSSSDQRAK